jgi:beta-lactamase class A
MRRRAFLWGGALGAATPSLDSAVRQRLRAFKIASVFGKNLDSGRTYGLRPDEAVRTASVIKLPVMVEAFAAVEEKRAAWDERIRMTADDVVSGSGVLREFSPGQTFALRDLVHLMIVVSDNTATNLVLDRLTSDAVNERMLRLGLHETLVMRKIRGDGQNLKANPGGQSEAGRLPANQRFGIGRSTSREMVRLLEMLDAGRVVTPEASREMLAILKRQQYRDGIARRHPDWVMANKTGALDALRSDAGIVYGKRAKIAMAITIDGMPAVDYSPDNPGLRAIADVSELLIQRL